MTESLTNRFIIAWFVLIIGLLTGTGLLAFGRIVILGLFVLPWFIILFYHRPMFLVLLWCALLPSKVLFADYTFKYSGFRLFPMDVAYFFTTIHLIINSVLRPKEIVRVLKENRFVILFLLLVGVYIVLYAPVYGKSALGEARKSFFYFFFPVLTTLSVREPKDLRRILLGVLFIAVCISLLGFAKLLTLQDGSYRPINSTGSLILLFALVSILVFHLNRVVITSPTIDGVMIVLFLSLIIITHHRTVWLAGASAMLLLHWFHRHQIKFFGKTLITSLLIVGVISVAVLSMPRFGEKFTTKAKGMVDPYSDPNALWRIERWKSDIQQIKEAPWFGKGLGGYYQVSYGSRGLRWGGVSPHNVYVQILLKFGFIGLILYGLLAYKFFRMTLKARQKLPPGDMRAYVEMGIVNFAAAHAFMLGYSFLSIMFIFFALSMSAVSLGDNPEAVHKPI